MRGPRIAWPVLTCINGSHAQALFIAEPLRLPAKIGVIRNPRKFLALHAVLLALALAAIFCGVIGARGGF